MTTAAEKHYQDWAASMGKLKAEAPEIAKGFGGMFAKLMGEGALSVREKELIALGIGMALQCEHCVFSHLEKAMKHGATREQIIELAGVVVTMKGGPGFVHVPMLLEALDALEAQGVAG